MLEIILCRIKFALGSPKEIRDSCSFAPTRAVLRACTFDPPPSHRLVDTIDIIDIANTSSPSDPGAVSGPVPDGSDPVASLASRTATIPGTMLLTRFT